MKKHISIYTLVLLTALTCSCWTGCSKQFSERVYPVAALNVVNALPTSAPLVLIQGSVASVIGNFSNISALSFGNTFVLTPMSGSEAFYAVQRNADTVSVGSKGPDFMFNGVLNFKAGGLYSLFITGQDTTNPDFLFVQDTLLVITDSAVGIRFVNLSTGSNPISINLEGNAVGSEVANLPYKSITGFKQYINNSATTDYLFVVRDAATGDSLTKFEFLASGSSNHGYGLTDPSNANNGTLLTFKHITIAVYGSESSASGNPLTTLLTDNY
jgi:hypothetical protein